MRERIDSSTANKLTPAPDTGIPPRWTLIATETSSRGRYSSLPGSTVTARCCPSTSTSSSTMPM